MPVPLFVINYIFAITVRIKAANICTTWGHEKKIYKPNKRSGRWNV